MAKIETWGIFSKITGRVGDVRFYTRNGKQFMRAYKPRIRTTKVTEKEIAHRERFGRICAEVARRIHAGDKRPRTEIWKEVSREIDE